MTIDKKTNNEKPNKSSEKDDLKVHVGELKGSYEYYLWFRRKHPTYDTIVSDYFKIDD